MRTGPRLSSVYVARTVQEGDTQTGDFLARLARHLGSNAIVPALSKAHLTLVESQGVRSNFRIRGYTPDDIRTFRGDLDSHLKDQIVDASPEVEIDSDNPLRWVGRWDEKLALNVVPDECLLLARKAVEEFLGERFGTVPKLRSFSPHITIAELQRPRFAAEVRNPSAILPFPLSAPGTVTLNGLEVRLG